MSTSHTEYVHKPHKGHTGGVHRTHRGCLAQKNRHARKEIEHGCRNKWYIKPTYYMPAINVGVLTLKRRYIKSGVSGKR